MTGGNSPRKIDITIPLAPTGQARPRFTRTGIAYKHKSQATREAQLLSYLVPFAPKEPSSDPLSLKVDAILPIPQSWPKKKKEAAILGEVPTTKKPDLSNIIKQIEDVMQGIFFVDDKQVCQISARKRYGRHPGWEITIQYWRP